MNILDFIKIDRKIICIKFKCIFYLMNSYMSISIEWSTGFSAFLYFHVFSFLIIDRSGFRWYSLVFVELHSIEFIVTVPVCIYHAPETVTSNAGLFLQIYFLILLNGNYRMITANKLI